MKKTLPVFILYFTLENTLETMQNHREKISFYSLFYTVGKYFCCGKTLSTQKACKSLR